MRNLEFVNRFVIADKSFEALGLQGERGVKLHKPDKSARDALGDSAPNPDGVLIRLHGVDAAGEWRQVNYSTDGEPVYPVLSPAVGDSFFATVRDFEQTYGLQVTRFRVRGIENPEQDWSSETLYDVPKGNATFIDSELLKQLEQVDIFPRYRE